MKKSRNSFDIEKCLAPIKQGEALGQSISRNSFDIEKCLALVAPDDKQIGMESRNSFDIEKCLAAAYLRRHRNRMRVEIPLIFKSV